MSTHLAIGVLALQGDTAEHVRALEDIGVTGTEVRHRADLDRIDGLILPGGESTTMSKLAARYELLEPLRKYIGDGMPVYGTCAGMILLADRILDGTEGQQSIGGIEMTVRRNAFGRQTESFEAPVAINGIGEEPLEAIFIRAPWVESVADGVTVLGSVTRGDHAGRIVAVRQGPLLATSFHPELTGDTRVHRLFVDMVKGQAYS